MSYGLDVRREARVDILEAAAWYDSQQVGLGAEFSKAVEIVIDLLGDNPLLYQIHARRHGREVRWLFPKRFPYRVIYYVEQKAVKIFAVLHAKRHDRAWQERV